MGGHVQVSRQDQVSDYVLRPGGENSEVQKLPRQEPLPKTFVINNNNNNKSSSSNNNSKTNIMLYIHIFTLHYIILSNI